MIVAKRLVIRGCVQGVGYREGMIDAAQACGVVGWVRNRIDGTVEAWVQGEPDAVERAIAWCRRGPRIACVTDVAVVEEVASLEISAFKRGRTE